MGALTLVAALWMALSDASPARARSLGRVEAGRLEAAKALPLRGDHHYVLPRRHRSRGLRFATAPLVDLLLEGALAVARRFPGSRLGVGNLSRKRGGRIRYSKSHQSGRDADIAFYMTDRRGRPVAPKDLLRFDRHGRGRGGYRFDLARNWALVEALLTSARAQVQWLLISDPLRARLLDYARTTGASPELIKRAADALHQPRWALPHDDHLHVRIYCSKEDLASGCKDTGPRWSWVDSASAASSTPVSEPRDRPTASLPDGAAP